jgi:hypothetical protein
MNLSVAVSIPAGSDLKNILRSVLQLLHILWKFGYI